MSNEATSISNRHSQIHTVKTVKHHHTTLNTAKAK